jgi:hypothetical protein
MWERKLHVKLYVHSSINEDLILGKNIVEIVEVLLNLLAVQHRWVVLNSTSLSVGCAES